LLNILVFCVVFVSFVYLRPVSWVPNVASVSEFLIATSFSSNVYLYIPLITSDGEFVYLVQYLYCKDDPNIFYAETVTDITTRNWERKDT
jgi:hypothetical protein